MVIEIFEIKDKQKNVCFFMKILLLANLNMNVVFKMLFLTLSNIKVHFIELKIY